MELLCHRCGNPTDVDAFHDMWVGGRKLSFDKARDRFFKYGCAAWDDGECDLMYEDEWAAEHGDFLREAQDEFGYDLEILATYEGSRFSFVGN